MIDPITSINAAATSSVNPMNSTVVNPADFGQWLTNNVAELNSTVSGSESTIKNLALNGDMTIHEAMISMQKAQLTLQFAAEVRNKILESYQEIMRMQL